MKFSDNIRQLGRRCVGRAGELCAAYRENSRVAPREEKRGYFLLSAGISVIMAFAMLELVVPCGGRQQLIRAYACLALALAAGVIVYFVAVACRSMKRAVCAALLTLPLLAFMLYLARPAEIIFQEWSKRLILISLVGIALFVFTSVKGLKINSRGWLFCTVAILGACYFAAWAYVPNLINQTWYTQHHMTAVTQTIYNVGYSLPFSYENTGVYGHYAIFFWPVIKLLGLTPAVVSGSLAVVNGAAYLLFACCVLKGVRNKWLRVLTLLAGIGFVCSDTPYLAVFPIRVVWPLGILAYTFNCNDKKKLLRPSAVIIGYALMACAIAWSTDSGLVALVAYTGCLWVGVLHGKRPRREKARACAGTAVGALLAVAGSVCIINAYNLLCGGSVILKECFFPLIGGKGYIGGLQTSMSLGVVTWVIPLLLFLMCIFKGLQGADGINAGEPTSIRFVFIGIMGIGQSYYFLNRSLAGWGCVSIYVALCIGMLSDGFDFSQIRACLREQSVYKLGVCMTRALCLCWVCMLAVCSVLISPVVIRNRLTTGAYSMESMDNTAEWVRENVPKNTAAFGFCMPELYAYLGWDPIWHGRDVSDILITPDEAAERGGEAVVKTLEAFLEEESVIVWYDQWSTWKDKGYYDVVSAYPQDNPILYYCKKPSK